MRGYAMVRNMGEAGIDCMHALRSMRTELPNEISVLSSLQRLELQSCQLVALPHSFGSLRDLRYLHLRFSALTSLPNSIGNLSSLRHLDLGFSGELTRLTDSFGRLISLQHLDLDLCKNSRVCLRALRV